MRELSRRLRPLLLLLQNSQLLPWVVRKLVLKASGVSVGGKAFIEPGNRFGEGGVRIGDRTFVNTRFLTDGAGLVLIGRGVRIGPGVQLLTGTHAITDDSSMRASFDAVYRHVTIEDGVWLGAGVIVLPGCTVRQGCVVGAGAVVVKDTTRDGLYLGVPAIRVRDLPTKDAVA